MAYNLKMKESSDQEPEGVVEKTSTENPRDSRHPYSEYRVGDQWQEIQGCYSWQDDTKSHYTKRTKRNKVTLWNEVLRSEICRNGEWAEACYDAFVSDKKDPKYHQCKYAEQDFFKALKLDNRGYEVTHYLRSGRVWMGFVARCTSLEERNRLGRWDIVVALRGTKTLSEWMKNVQYSLIPLEPSNLDKQNCLPGVERGFSSMFEEFSKSLLTAITDNIEKYETKGIYDVSITFTGHSLGSALAILGAHHVASNLKNRVDSRRADSAPDDKKLKTFTGGKIPITVISIAGPRVGNRGFKTIMEEDLGVAVLRVVSKYDIVPNFPSSLTSDVERFYKWSHLTSYNHVGQVLKIHNSLSPYLKRNLVMASIRAHKLQGQLHILDGYDDECPNPTRCPMCSEFKFKPSWRDPALVNKKGDFLKRNYGIPPRWGADPALVNEYGSRSPDDWGRDDWGQRTSSSSSSGDGADTEVLGTDHATESTASQCLSRQRTSVEAPSRNLNQKQSYMERARERRRNIRNQILITIYVLDYDALDFDEYPTRVRSRWNTFLGNVRTL